MKTRYLRLKHWLLVSLMTSMGLAGCQSARKAAGGTAPDEPATPGAPRELPRGREEMRLMYGVPTMNYMIRGQVKDQADRPVEGIKVTLLEQGLDATPDTVYGDAENVRRYLEEESVTTDRDGRFSIRESGVPQEEMRLLVRDTDGEKHGNHKNRIVHLKAADGQLDRTGAGGWNAGTMSHEVEIRLEPKEYR